MLGRLAAAALTVTVLLNPLSYAGMEIPPESRRDSTVRFRLLDGHMVVVPVSVNGLEPMSFILDTGTRTTMIDEGVSRSLNLAPVARMPLTVLTGTMIVNIARLDTIAIGSVSALGHEVSCVNLRKAFSLDREVRGVLGQDFLSRINYLLDYRARKMVIDVDGSLEKELLGTAIPIEKREYRDHVRCDSGSGSPEPILFMLDSGARSPMVFENPRLYSALGVVRESRFRSFEGSLGSRRIGRGASPACASGTS